MFHQVNPCHPTMIKNGKGEPFRLVSATKSVLIIYAFLHKKDNSSVTNSQEKGIGHKRFSIAVTTWYQWINNKCNRRTKNAVTENANRKNGLCFSLLLAHT